MIYFKKKNFISQNCLRSFYLSISPALFVCDCKSFVFPSITWTFSVFTQNRISDMYMYIVFYFYMCVYGMYMYILEKLNWRELFWNWSIWTTIVFWRKVKLYYIPTVCFTTNTLTSSPILFQHVWDLSTRQNWQFAANDTRPYVLTNQQVVINQSVHDSVSDY